MSVFRASSLAAVTILVCSTRLNPISTAHWRVTCRTRTTSSSEWTPIVSSRPGAIELSGLAQASADQSHALLRVQGGADSFQVQPELDQRNRDRRPHADDDGLRVQDARHVRDVPQGAADERIDDLEGGDVDEHAPRAVLDDLVGQLVLQRHHEPVVHLDLNGDEQELPHLEDGDALAGGLAVKHARRFSSRWRRRGPSRARARRRAWPWWRPRRDPRPGARWSGRSGAGCR